VLIAPHEYPADHVVTALPTLLDEQAVLDACRSQLVRSRDTSEDQNWCAAKRIETLYHPNRYAKVVYALLSDPSTPANRYWPTGQLVYLYAPARQSSSRRGEIIQIGGQDVEAYQFPNDRRLRGVRHFAGREPCVEVWQDWLQASDIQATVNIDTLQRLLVRYVPEQKWIVRLRAELDGWSDHRGSNKQRIAIRAASPESIGRLTRRHHALAKLSTSSAACFQVPAVVGASSEKGLLGVEWIRGHQVVEAIAEQGYEEILPGIASRLHTLHNYKIEGLDRVTQSDMSDRIESAYTDLATAHPAQQDALNTLKTQWKDRFQKMPEPVEIATIHNDFHWNQLSIKRDRYALFDLERMANADPLLDVANFSSQLYMLGHRPEIGVTSKDAQQWRDAFLANWQQETGQSIDRHRLGCYAALSKLDLARGMMRHLRPGWKILADKCIEFARDDLNEC